MAEKFIHEGHRQRLKDRFLAYGIDSFTDIQALELLLFYSIPRRDTNPIAHKLLDHFGGLYQVMEAPVEELEKVAGISKNSAALIQLVRELGRKYQVDRAQQVSILSTTDEIGKYLLPFFYGRKLETVFLLCMDAKCKVITCKEIGEGGINESFISPRKVAEVALGVGATTVVLAHNHPSGLAIPSPADIEVTRRIGQTLKAMDIYLVDHIIVADGDFVSVAQTEAERKSVPYRR